MGPQRFVDLGFRGRGGEEKKRESGKKGSPLRSLFVFWGRGGGGKGKKSRKGKGGKEEAAVCRFVIGVFGGGKKTEGERFFHSTKKKKKKKGN